MTTRQTVLLVGPDRPRRSALSEMLVARGYSVLLCAGPPGCSLERDGRCVVVDAADVAVILPGASGPVELSACAAEAPHAVFVAPPPFPAPPHAVVVNVDDPAAIADAVDAVLGASREHPTRIDRTIDARGLVAPATLMTTISVVNAAPGGTTIEILTGDEASAEDLRAWIAREGHDLITVAQRGQGQRLVVRVRGARPLEGGRVISSFLRPRVRRW